MLVSGRREGEKADAWMEQRGHEGCDDVPEKTLVRVS